MIKESKGLKKIDCQILEKLNRFFFTDFGSKIKNKSFSEVDSLAKGVIIFPFRNVIRRGGEQLSEIKRKKSLSRFFLTLRRIWKAFQSLLTLSFSFAKLKYPLSRKTIFVYLVQKKDWLIRLDNNTGCSSMKILQTTII